MFGIPRIYAYIGLALALSGAIMSGVLEMSTKVGEVIPAFTGEFRFLSNFYPCTVSLSGFNYPSVEHAYQAAKTDDLTMREVIRECKQPGGAKKIGKSMPIRPNWERERVEIMRGLLRQKFFEPKLREQLLSTWPAKLIEGNYWGDCFWGVSYGSGQNMLGKLLMELREEIHSEQQESKEKAR